VSTLGRASGRHLYALARNEDPRPVRPRPRRRSIGAQRALGRSRRSIEDIDAVLLGLVDRVTRRMRGAKRVGRTVVLRLRFDDFSRATRSSTLEQATAQTKTVLDTSRVLLTTALPIIDRQGLTLIGLSVGNLENARAQLTLPLDSPDRAALDAALDTIRDHYGASAITRATLLGRDSGLEMPLLPD
jgi:DNA polymerase-4